MEKLINNRLKPAEAKFLVDVGNKIMACRKSQILTRGKLSKLSGISYGRLTNIELGKVDCEIKEFAILSRVLKVDTKEFMP